MSNFDETIKNIGSLVLFMLFIGALTRFTALEQPRDFWHDEAFQYLYSKEPVTYILDSNDVHPPVFNLITHCLITWFGITSIQALRFCMVILGLVFIVSAYYVFSRLFNTRVGLLTMAGLATAPTYIFYSTEFRNYMFALVIVIWQMFFFHRLLLKHGIMSLKTRDAVLYVVASVLMLATHYMTGLIILTQAVYLFVNGQAWRARNLYFAIVALSAPVAVYLARTLPKLQSFWFKDIDIVSLVSTFVFIIVPPVTKIIGWSLILYGTAIVTYIMFREQLPEHYHLYVSYLTLPVVIMWGISQFLPFYHHRYFLFGGIGLFVVIALGVDKLAEKLPDIELVYLGSLMMLMLFTLQPMFASYDTELMEASRFLKQYSNNTQQLIVFHDTTFSQSPMKVYLPDSEHYLVSNLTKEQLFTAGGSVVKMSEHIPSVAGVPTGSLVLGRPAGATRKVWVSDIPKGDIIWNKGGLYIGKI